MRNSILIILAFLITICSFSRSPVAKDIPENIADYIEASIENENPSYVNSLFAYDYFSDKLLNFNPNYKEFNKIFKSEIVEFLDPGNIILEQVKSGTYKFINSYFENNILILIYRANTETGLDYHEYHFKEIDKLYKIIDIYMYYDEMLLSEQVSGLYNILSQNYLPDSYCKKAISDTKRLLVTEQKLLKSLLKASYKKTLKQWDNLEIDIKYNRKIMSYAIRAASYSSLEDMKDIYKNFTNSFNHTGGVDLIVLEGLFEQKEYKLTLQYIDNLDMSVHNDPYLNYLRASVYKTIEKPEKAEWFLNKFIEDLPQDQSGYFSLLELYLENSNFNDATILLDKLTDMFGFYKEELKPILINYPSYIDSEEYAQWVKE